MQMVTINYKLSLPGRHYDSYIIVGGARDSDSATYIYNYDHGVYTFDMTWTAVDDLNLICFDVYMNNN